MSSIWYRGNPAAMLGYQDPQLMNQIGPAYMGETMTCREGQNYTKATSSGQCYTSPGKCNSIYGSLQGDTLPFARCPRASSYMPWVYDAGSWSGIISHFCS